jgi:hypothetical protein
MVLIKLGLKNNELLRKQFKKSKIFFFSKTQIKKLPPIKLINLKDSLKLKPNFYNIPKSSSAE